MATSYDVIYKRFLNSIQDFNIVDLDDDVIAEMMQSWLLQSIITTRKCEHDFTLRDDEAQEFTEDLSELEIQLLSKGMVVAWLDQYINSTEYTTQFIGGKEEKFYAQANHLNSLLAMREQTQREIKQLHTYHTYANNTYFTE